MIPSIPVVSSNIADWIRRAATTVNEILRLVSALSNPAAISFKPTTAPATPVEGQAYYDAAAHMLKVYDGTTWQDCW